MKSPLLIDVPKTHPSRVEKLSAWKNENHIWTHSTRHESSDKWCAMAVQHSVEKLEGYGVTAKDSPIEIIGGYCRLLDEAGLLVTGATEREAIEELCKNINILFPL